jgi:HPt (histidine-containing phosphotransfer) domain-containing protein
VALDINREELLENFMGDEELLFESIDLFLERAETRYQTLVAAVRDRDAVKIMEEGHTIKGMVGIFSTGSPFEAAKKLEFMGRNKEMDGLDEALSDFKDQLDELTGYLTDWKDEVM